MVLAGHDHNYERLLVEGLPYIVNGLGGRSRYELNPVHVPQSQFTFNADYGAMLLTATADSLLLQFFTRRQVLVDSYVLHRSPGTEPTRFRNLPWSKYRCRLLPTCSFGYSIRWGRK